MKQANWIDVSRFQNPGDFDYKAAKQAGIVGIIIRATSGLSLDIHVKEHLANAKRYGFKWHLYHDWEGHAGEAEYAIKTAQELGLSSDQVLFYDMEGTHAGNWSAIFEDFRQKASSHFKVGLYISESPYQERFNDKQLQAEHVIRWIANYSKEPQSYDIWQISGAGSGGFGKYTKDVDRDFAKNGVLDYGTSKPNDNPKTPTSPMTEAYRPIVLDYGYDRETGVYGRVCSPDNGQTTKIYFTAYGIVWHQDDVDVLWDNFLKNKITSAMSIDWDSIQNKPKFVTSDELEARLNKLSVPTIKWADIEDKPTIPSTDGLVSKNELSDYAKLSQIPKMPDLSAMLVDYVKKTELPDFTQFAKRSDIPSIADLVNKAELIDYVKKTDLPDFSQYATKADLSSSSGVKQADLDKVKATADSATSKAEQAQSTADANTKALQNVYTKEEADQKYWTAEQEQDAESNLSTNIQELIDDKVNADDVYTKSEIDSQNASNVKSVNNVKPDDQGNVNIDLTGYVKQDELPKSMSWSQITDKPNLALSSDIPSLDGYAKLTDIPSVTGLVKETELSDYARKSDLPTMPDLSGYATISSLIDYVKKTDLPDFTLFAKKSDIPTIPKDLVHTNDLDVYAKKSDIPAEQDLSNYVKKPDLNNYVTIDNLQTSLNNQNQVQTITSGTLADLANKRGSYHYEIECCPSDTPIQEWGLCDVIVGQHYAKQVFTVTGATDDDQGNVYVRVRDYSGKWHEWRELTAWN